jgi:ABC-type multidrug transport system ATPase subunit
LVNKGLSVADLDVHTVKQIHFDILPGRCMGLAGPSGSGKTLILRALADLDPHDGRIWLDGIPATAIPAPQWRRRVGMLPAETAWWHDTVRPHFSEVPEQWLADLGFDLPVMDQPIRRLSGGERQRLGLLRLLVNRPRVLLLDEPTANLDTDSALRVENLLAGFRLRHDTILLWVGHDRDQLRRNCDVVCTIEGDRITTAPKNPMGNAGAP